MLAIKSRLTYQYKINNAVLCADTGRLERAQHGLEERRVPDLSISAASVI